MKTKVQKWGNSLGLRIPRALADEAAVADGSTVDLTVDRRGRLIVSAVREAAYELEELLALLTDDNLHLETWADHPRGARPGERRLHPGARRLRLVAVRPASGA